MSVVLQIYAIIVTLSLIIVLSFYLFHRREVTRLSQKLQTLLHSFTHAELTLDFPSSDITDLVNALNELLRVYHKQVYSLQKKDEAIKETITNLAHDLRTPVTAIQGYTKNASTIAGVVRGRFRCSSYYKRKIECFKSVTKSVV